MSRELKTEYGVHEQLRCLIGNYFFKDIGGTKRRCVNCGEEEND